MSDTDRVFTYEADDMKGTAKIQMQVDGGDCNNVKDTPGACSTQIMNMIQAPGNCPPGHEMGADGVCREVFD